MRRLLCIAAFSGLFLGEAEAQDDLIASPRSVGRAGTSLVSGDSGMALVTNPGGMVRRSQPRLLLSTSVADSDSEYQDSARSDSPAIVDRAAPQSLPVLAYHHGNEQGTWVLGALLAQGTQSSVLPTPAFGQPAEDVARLFPHRYSSTGWKQEWRLFALGGALRLGESVGLGASVSLKQIELRESRHIWAGFAGRDELLDANLDLALDLKGRDSASPGASVGLLIAPPEIPVEFAVSFAFRRGGRLGDSSASLRSTSTGSFPGVAQDNPSSSLKLPSHYDGRVGLRYLGDRSFLELSAEYYYRRNDQQRLWSVEGIEVVDQSGLTKSIAKVGATLSGRSHLALRAAVDYEAISGFLWLTAGYGYQSPATRKSLLSPGIAQLGGHTLAVGLETAYEGYIITLGYARKLTRSRSVDALGSHQEAFNPFDAGSGPSNTGHYQQSSDQLGFAVEVGF